MLDFLPFYSVVSGCCGWKSGICLTLAELGEGVVEAEEFGSIEDEGGTYWF